MCLLRWSCLFFLLSSSLGNPLSTLPPTLPFNALNCMNTARHLGANVFCCHPFRYVPSKPDSNASYLRLYLFKYDVEHCVIVVRCISSCMRVDCWTAALRLRPFITARWWAGRSSGRGGLSLCWLERWSRYSHMRLNIPTHYGARIWVL